MKLIELKAAKADRIANLNAITESLTEANPIMTEAQEAQFVSLEGEIRSLSTTIEMAERAKAMNTQIQAPTNIVKLPDLAGDVTRKADPESGFQNFAEFLFSALKKPNDPRLQAYLNEQTMGTGSEGGFAVPKQWSSELLRVSPAEAIMEPRARVIPAGSPPDAEISFPALNQQAGSNMYGGVTLSWINEGGAKPETDASLKEITLKPQELAAHIVVTDKLLRNWGAASSFLADLLRMATVAEKDLRFIRGDGIAKPQGFMGSVAEIAVNRAVANLIDTADILAMLTVLFMRGVQPIWIASQTTLPQLYTLEDAVGNNIFLASIVPGAPDTLMGRPLLWSERVPALGTKGDLSLIDPSAYMVKNGSGPFVGSSPHVHYLTNKTVIKTFLNVDGQPQLTGPILSEDAVERSPFIVLDVP